MGSETIPIFELDRFNAIAIGSSTGGPTLVDNIISGLPADLRVPVFIAQHMPPQFTKSFSHQLNLSSPLTVVHAEDDMPVYPGTVYVGVGHQHLRVKRVGSTTTRIVVSPSPQELLYKPSVDELFSSCANTYKQAILSIVMTGIGNDGTKGAQTIKSAGGVVLTQSEKTCAVYGMPRSCVNANLSDASLSPDQIRDTLLQFSPQHRDQAATR